MSPLERLTAAQDVYSAAFRLFDTFSEAAEDDTDTVGVNLAYLMGAVLTGQGFATLDANRSFILIMRSDLGHQHPAMAPAVIGDLE